MKRATKFVIGTAAMVAVSAGVAGVTAYTLIQKNQQQNANSFYDVFKGAPMRTVALDATSMQPVDLTQAAESSLNSVVHIMAIQRSKVKTVQTQPDLFDFFFGNGRGGERQVQVPEQRGFGSGVIISKDGYIVTNNHVIDGADEISVKLHDSRELKGRVIGTDPTSDLALVKIEGDDFPAIPVGDSDALKVGEWVLAVGNPFNLGSTVTAGVVSAKARGLGANQVESFIQTDAAINPGNSGGALVNASGEVIGINSSKLVGDSVEGVGYAIPISDVSDLIQNLMNQATKTKVAEKDQGAISIKGMSVPAEYSKQLNMPEGVYVSEITKGGGAEAAGMAKGSVITAIDGTTVSSMDDLQEQLQYYAKGDKVSLTIQIPQSNGEYEEKTVDVTLGAK